MPPARVSRLQAVLHRSSRVKDSLRAWGAGLGVIGVVELLAEYPQLGLTGAGCRSLLGPWPDFSPPLDCVKQRVPWAFPIESKPAQVLT